MPTPRLRFALPSVALAAATVAVMTLTTAACGDTHARVTVRDSSGVRLVLRSGPTEPLPWGLDTVRVLGGASEGPAGFYLVLSSLVDVDARGRIYVLDHSQSHVAIFDSTGAVLGVRGTKGDGPGELRFPVSVSASDDGAVSVFDGNKRALVRFAPDGTVLEQTRFPYAVINMGFAQFQVEPDGIVLWARPPVGPRTAGEAREDRLIHVSGGDSVALLPPLPSHTASSHFDACGITFTMRVPLSPFPRWSQSGRRVAVSDWAEYRVDVFDGDHLVERIRSDDAGPTLDAAGAARLLEEHGLTGGPCNSTPRDLVDRYGFAPTPQVISDLALAPDGEIWVEMGVSYGARRIDVFDRDGGYVGSLDRHFPFPLAFLPDGRPLIALRDSLDVERLGIARITGR